MEDILDVQPGSGVDVTVPALDNTGPQFRVSGDWSQLDHRISFVISYCDHFPGLRRMAQRSRSARAMDLFSEGFGCRRGALVRGARQRPVAIDSYDEVRNAWSDLSLLHRMKSAEFSLFPKHRWANIYSEYFTGGTPKGAYKSLPEGINQVVERAT